MDQPVRDGRALGRVGRRLSALDVAFIAAAILTFVALLYLGRVLTFFHDEWFFIDTRLGWSLEAFMAPHNEHWVLGMVLFWKPLLATVGLSSYLPYLALMLAAHLATAAAVYWWLRRQAGGYVAFCGGLLFLLLGTASEVLYQGFTVNLVASTAAGAWALVLFLADPVPRRPWLVALLLVVSIATSGAGLFFMAAIGGVVAIGPRRLRQGWVVIPAAAAYLGWLLTYGRNSLGGGAAGLLADPEGYLEYIRLGVAHAVGSLTGLGTEIGFVLAVLLVVATIAHLLGSGPVLEGAVAGVTGLLIQFVLTGIARAEEDPGQAEAPRYGYMAAVFLLVAVSAWLGSRPRLRRARRDLLPLAAITAVTLAANLLALAHQHALYVVRADETRAAVTVLTTYGGSPAIPADRRLATQSGFLQNIPAPDRLREIIAALGSPLDDVLVPGTTPVPQDVMDRVLFSLVGGSLQISAAPGGVPAGATAPAVRSSSGVAVEPDGSCLRLIPTGPDPHVVTVVTAGSSLYARAERAGGAQLFLSTAGTFTELASARFDLAAGSVFRMTLPDLGSGFQWFARFDPPADGATLVCLASA
ncbi:MAG: hypothetical protein QOH61_2726 [Chloroflexota bacterium]|nr:hypothetical protein [Chloroflexota bacterium]